MNGLDTARRSRTGSTTSCDDCSSNVTPGWCWLPPFKWSDDRRAVLRAELDAWYARLYGLTRKQLRYILDPHGLSERELADNLDTSRAPPARARTCRPQGPPGDLPGKTFRVLKEKEEKAHGEYRTPRLVLEAWEGQQQQRSQQ